MQEGSWIDANTRRIQVFVHVWNINTDIVQSHEMAVLFYTGGNTRVFFSERHSKSDYYNDRSGSDVLRSALELVSLAFLCYFWVIELQKIYFSWRGRFLLLHFNSGWNSIDLMHCIFMTASAVLWAVIVSYLPKEHLLSLVDADDHVAAFHALALLDYFPLHDQYVLLSSITVFFNLLKVLKASRFHFKTSAVVNTISNMALPLLNFIIGFSVLFFSFVYIAHVDFGLYLRDWHTISFAAGSAVNAIFQSLPLSDIDHLPTFASGFFFWEFGFVVVVNFIAMNLIVAIIIEGYMLTLERKEIARATTPLVSDQVVGALLEFFCMPFALLFAVPWFTHGRMRQRVQGVHHRLSAVFGRRLQIQHFASDFILKLNEFIVVPPSGKMEFGLIISQLVGKFAFSVDDENFRAAISEVLIHFMQNIDKTQRKKTQVLPTIESARCLVNQQSQQSTQMTIGEKSRVQLRDEVVLMLRSHAQTLQRHSDFLHVVSDSCGCM
jgi:hypothetical protein